MIDIVVDTNVLAHGVDPRQAEFDAVTEFIEKLLDMSTALCFDEGFNMVEADNRSTIMSEYRRHLVPGSLPYILLLTKADNGQIRELSTAVSNTVRRRINQLIRNTVDRTFLRVAVNSAEKVLASHDYTDYQPAKRITIRDEIGVVIRSAGECCAVLAVEE